MENMTDAVEIASRISMLEERVTAALRRIDEQSALTKAVQDLALSMQRLSYAQETMADKMQSMESRVATIESRPARRWESAVEKALAAIVGGLVVAAMAKIGL